MLVYYIMVGLPLIYLGIAYSFENIDKKKANRHAMIIFFTVITVLLALRHESIGTDTSSYVIRFKYMCSTPLSYALDNVNVEPGYLVLNKIVSMFTSNSNIFIAVTTFLSIIPIAYFYVRNVENAPVAMSIFLVLPMFIVLFSGIRQNIAMAFIPFVYHFVKKKKILPYIALVFLAYTFHQSALVLLLLYPIYHLNLERKNAWIVVPIIGIVYLFNDKIFLFLIQYMGKYEERYSEIENTGSTTMLMLFILFALFSFIAVDEDKMDKETKGMRNLLIMSVGLQLFVPLNTIVMRMNYYYLMFLPICMSKIVNRYRDEEKEIGAYITLAICAFFFLFYMYTSHTKDSMEIYPYIPFWKG